MRPREATLINQAAYPYDAVFVSFSMTNHLVPVVIGQNRYPNGLVFDSRVYTPLSDVAPVESNDCGVFGCSTCPCAATCCCRWRIRRLECAVARRRPIAEGIG